MTSRRCLVVMAVLLMLAAVAGQAVAGKNSPLPVLQAKAYASISDGGPYDQTTISIGVNGSGYFSSAASWDRDSYLDPEVADDVVNSGWQYRLDGTNTWSSGPTGTNVSISFSQTGKYYVRAIVDDVHSRPNTSDDRSSDASIGYAFASAVIVVYVVAVDLTKVEVIEPATPDSDECVTGKNAKFKATVSLIAVGAPVHFHTQWTFAGQNSGLLNAGVVEWTCAVPATATHKLNETVTCTVTVHTAAEAAIASDNTPTKDVKVLFEKYGTNDTNGGTAGHPNWFNHWKAIGALAVYAPVNYVTNGGSFRGVFDPTSPNTINVGAAAATINQAGHAGIDCFAATLMHEDFHRQHYNETQPRGANPDYDGDWLKDTDETLGDLNFNGRIDTEDLNGNGILDLGEDLNANGVLDPGEDIGNGILDFGEDLDNDGILDPAEDAGNGILDGSEDIDNDGILDPAELDLDGDGFELCEDRNGNGRLDSDEDLNGNGILDPGEDIGDGVLDTEDQNGNGILDLSEDLDSDGILDPAEDLDGDGVMDLDEDVNGNGWLDPGEDVDNDGVLDFDEDVNNNGVLDPGEDVDGDNVMDFDEDVNNNGVLDLSEDVDGDGAMDFNEDVNNNGVLDPAEDVDNDGVMDPGEDVNNNRVLDFGEDTDRDGILDPGEDIGNGILDSAEDVNGNGILDWGEDTNNNGVQDPAEDANGNGVLDRGEDQNGNGVLDPGEDIGNGLLDPGEDANNNGVLDPAEDVNGNGILDGSEDTNNNFVLDPGEDIGDGKLSPSEDTGLTRKEKKVSDAAESSVTYGQGDGLLTSEANSLTGTSAYHTNTWGGNYDDEDDSCYEREKTWNAGALDNDDWAQPGKQSNPKY